MTTQAVIDSLLARQGYDCPVCLSPIDRFENKEVDHIVATGLGGSDHIDNLRVLHRACHRRLKTPQDIKAIRKADRQAKETAAHEEALRTGTRRPNAKERLRRKWDERRPTPCAPRQD